MLRVAVTFLAVCLAVTLLNAARADAEPAASGAFRETHSEYGQ